MAIDIKDPEFVTALSRGLGVIACFGPGAEMQTISNVAKRVNLSRGSARRLLLTLEAIGFIRMDGKLFSLTPKILMLGYAYLSSMPLWKKAQPIMQDVVNELNQSCSLGVLDGTDVVYLARIPPNHLAYLAVTPGTRMPAHMNAMGLALLAQLDDAELSAYFKTARFEKLTRMTLSDETAVLDAIHRTARRGYAVSDQQIQIGIRSIAVPIPSRKGRPQFAINASTQVDQTSDADFVLRDLPSLRRAADLLAHAVE
jgi:IclR family pca regulon transcriptional regulator